MLGFRGNNKLCKSQWCNRLPVSKLAPPYDSPPLFSAAIVHHFSFNGTSSSASPTVSPTPFCHLFHVFIPVDFHRFTIKSLMQFLALQSLQLWARIALSAEPSIYYLISKAFSITATTFVVSRASSFTKRTYDQTKRADLSDRRPTTDQSKQKFGTSK